MRIVKKSAVIFLTAVIVVSCDFMEVRKKGEIRLSISGNGVTKSSYEIPDSNNFILEVKSTEGTPVFYGKYGESPVSMSVDEGGYVVRVVSGEFCSPAFESPQLGDEQTVSVAPGAITSVMLSCRQMNSGLRIIHDSSFSEKYPGAVLSAICREGNLDYLSGETRTGYFLPGDIEIRMDYNDTVRALITRTLAPQAVHTLTVRASGESGQDSRGIICSGFDIDTTRIWSSEEYTIGKGGKGGTIEDALSVKEASSSAGASSVWVRGYVVGGDLSSGAKGISFDAPFSSRSNIAISSRASVDNKAMCLSVQLSSGEIRDKLNLVDNPDNLGKEIFLKGDIVEAYYGIPGMKNISEYILR